MPEKQAGDTRSTTAKTHKTERIEEGRTVNAPAIPVFCAHDELGHSKRHKAYA